MPSAAQFDDIVQLVYRAATGLDGWGKPLSQIADASGAWSVGITTFDRQSGAVRSLHSGGPRPARAVREYVDHYYRIDPRIAKLRARPVGRWLACQEHFDDAFVASDPFYQGFLLPHGARYLYAVKLADTDDTMVVMSHHRPAGQPMVDPEERNAVERIGRHVSDALRIGRELDGVATREVLGQMVLERMRQPVVVLDRDRRITFRSEVVRSMLEAGDPLGERHGILACADSESDAALWAVIKDFARPRTAAEAPAPKRVLRVRCSDPSRVVVVTLLALPGSSEVERGSRASVALLVIHEAQSRVEIEPGFLASAFGFTPAEARMASRLAAGHTVDEIATELDVSVATVRTQLRSTFEKTGTKRQTDLVRLLMAMSAY